MDALLSSLIHSLQSHHQTCDIDIKTQPPVSENDVSSWEYQHCVFLPPDMRDYYLSENGMLLTWSIKAGTNVHRVGRVVINELNGMEIVQVEAKSKQNLIFKPPVKIIKIDENPSVGRICLLYMQRINNDESNEFPWDDPQICLLRHGGKIEILTDSFTNYFRLMIAYAGLEEWPNRVLGMALSPVAKQWYYIMGKLSLVEE